MEVKKLCGSNVGPSPASGGANNTGNLGRPTSDDVSNPGR